MFLSKVYAKIVGDDEEAEERKRREEERREKRGNPLEGLPNCEITGRDFQVRPICHYGVPDSASCFAFDPLQLVVAIGSMDGMVKIFGRPGVEQTFCGSGGRATRHLAFVTNKHRLVAVYAGGLIEVIDLEMRKSIGSTNLGEEVTILQKGDPLSPYVFLGTENGNVIVVHALQDVRTVAVSNYSVNYSVCSGGSQALASGSKKVTVLAVNPTDEVYLLVGFESGLLVQWNLKSRSVQRQYSPVIPGLTAGAWHADGQKFAAGYADGSVHVWKRNNAKSPIQQISVNSAVSGRGATEELRRPVTSICCSTFNRTDVVFVLGGQPVSAPSNGVQWTVTAAGQEEILEERWIEVATFPHDSVIDFCVVHEQQPWLTAANPTHIFLLTQSGKVGIGSIQYQPGGAIGWDRLPTPRCSSFYQPSLTSTCFVRYYSLRVASLALFPKISGGSTSDLVEDLMAKAPLRLSDIQRWPISGGSADFDKSIIFREMLMTGHQNGKIHFWNITAGALSLFSIFGVQSTNQHSPSSSSKDQNSPERGGDTEGVASFKHTKLCPYARILAISYENSNILSIFHTSHIPYPSSVLDISEVVGKGPAGSKMTTVVKEELKEKGEQIEEGEEDGEIVDEEEGEEKNQEGEKEKGKEEEKEDEGKKEEKKPMWNSRNPFFKHILEIRMPGDITCFELCSGLGIIVVGDSQGTLAIINLFKGECSFLYSFPDKSPVTQAMVYCAVVNLAPRPPAPRATPQKQDNKPTTPTRKNQASELNRRKLGASKSSPQVVEGEESGVKEGAEGGGEVKPKIVEVVLGERVLFGIRSVEGEGRRGFSHPTVTFVNEGGIVMHIDLLSGFMRAHHYREKVEESLGDSSKKTNSSSSNLPRAGERGGEKAGGDGSDHLVGPFKPTKVVPLMDDGTQFNPLSISFVEFDRLCDVWEKKKKEEEMGGETEGGESSGSMDRIFDVVTEKVDGASYLLFGSEQFLMLFSLFTTRSLALVDVPVVLGHTPGGGLKLSGGGNLASEIVSMSVVSKQGQHMVVCLMGSGDLCVFSLMHLQLLFTLPAALTRVIKVSTHSFVDSELIAKSFELTEDGQIVVFTPSIEFIRGSLFGAQGCGPLPKMYLHKDGVLTPAKPEKGFLKSLFSGDVNYDSLFGNFRQAPPPETSASGPSNTGPSNTAGPSNTGRSGATTSNSRSQNIASGSSDPSNSTTTRRDADERRKERMKEIEARRAAEKNDLLGGSSASGRTRNEPQTTTHSKAAVASAASARSTMEENADKLAERGEKISKMEEETRELVGVAREYRENIQRLKQAQQKESSWFPF